MCDQTMLAFVAASLAIILAPGPAQALVLSKTIESGRAVGIHTAVGLNVATLVHAAAAGLGLSALLASSALAFGVVKILGAGYLVYLGVRALAKADRTPGAAGVERSVPRPAFVQAFVTGLLNPKVALFFLAFLPQFVCPSRGSVIVQFLLLGGILALLDAIYEAGLALIAASAMDWLASPLVAAWRSRITGGVLIGLGAKLLFAERR